MQCPLTGLTQLQLCDCERADGFPSGLGCTKEGYFIIGFENQGTWVRAAVHATLEAGAAAAGECSGRGRGRGSGFTG